MAKQKSKAHKFKNIHKKLLEKKSKEKVVFKSKKQFPNFYRFITEQFTGLNKRSLIIFFMLLLFLSISIAALRLFYIITIEQYATNKTQNLTKKLLYWEGIVNEYPGYADGYVQLASAAYSLGDKKAAIVYIQKAQNLDQNNLEIQQVAKKIEK